MLNKKHLEFIDNIEDVKRYYRVYFKSSNDVKVISELYHLLILNEGYIFRLIASMIESVSKGNIYLVDSETPDVYEKYGDKTMNITIPYPYGNVFVATSIDQRLNSKNGVYRRDLIYKNEVLMSLTDVEYVRDAIISYRGRDYDLLRVKDRGEFIESLNLPLQENRRNCIIL
jgi:hypothetical protein